jgi:hypothetical protein
MPTARRVGSEKPDVFFAFYFHGITVAPKIDGSADAADLPADGTETELIRS